MTKPKEEKMKAREKIYQILKVNDATNEASWWQIADEVVEAIDKAVTEERERIIDEVYKLRKEFIEILGSDTYEEFPDFVKEKLSKTK